MKKRREITIETESVWIIHQRRRRVHVGCAVCDPRVEMLTAEDAAALCQVSHRAIYRGVEQGRIHFSETADGWLLVCPASLLEGLKESLRPAQALALRSHHHDPD